MPRLMDFVLISARGANDEPHWSRATAALVAQALTSQGAAVRWLCARNAREPAPAAVAGLEIFDLPAAPVPFRAVEARVIDNPMDILLAQQMRKRPPDLVMQLGVGAISSANPLWIADRMGAPGLAVVRATELLCHRGTLVNERGTACRSVFDAARCTTCCNSASPQGPTKRAAIGALCLRWLGGCSPFPSPVQFLNRADLLLASLQLAAAVVTSDAAELALLASAGLPARTLVASSGVSLVDTIVDLALRLSARTVT
ncbi:MAG: hypothetical protein NT107_09880 [Planctomycetota bacterium]|nr:hypothetical protein [Planctomycetota bacterium]